MILVVRHCAAAVWWNLRFFARAAQGYQFEDAPVQRLVAEHKQRFWTPWK